MDHIHLRHRIPQRIEAVGHPVREDHMLPISVR